MTSYQQVEQPGQQASLAETQGVNCRDFIDLPPANPEQRLSTGQPVPVVTEQGTK